MRAFSIFSTPHGLSDAERLVRRHMLARMGLAWLVMMQVATLAFPGYLRSDTMGADNLALLDQAIIVMNWISLGLSIPVITYCAWPVWRQALRRLRERRVTMDVPVALGIAVAFIPSVITTFTQHGHVYFESVSMFVAFLLTARYLELCASQSVGRTAMTSQQQRHHQRLAQQADRVAFWFVIAQLALAFIAGAVWAFVEPAQALAVMVAMIVISCPCAMAMAVPVSVAAAQASLSVKARSGQVSPHERAILDRATQRNARQNLYGAVGWHLLVTPLAALGWVAPWLAAITMLLSTISVALNGMRLYRRFAHQNAAEPWDTSLAQGQGA